MSRSDLSKREAKLLTKKTIDDALKMAGLKSQTRKSAVEFIHTAREYAGAFTNEGSAGIYDPVLKELDSQVPPLAYDTIKSVAENILPDDDLRERTINIISGQLL